MSKGINWNRPSFRAHREREQAKEAPIAGTISALPSGWATILREMDKGRTGAERADASGWTKRPKRGR